MDPIQQEALYRHIQSRYQYAKAHPPLLEGLHSRGYLPHLKKQGAMYAVTFRLADALPREVMQLWREELDRRLSVAAPSTRHTRLQEVQNLNRGLQVRIQNYLDQGYGACYLRLPQVASLVCEALMQFDRDRYLLDEWTLMPNHVHTLIQPLGRHQLSEILGNLKGFTSRQANRVLGRTGQRFWQHESYDHIIRDDEELNRWRHYIRMNPVKARLCQTPEDWRWGKTWKGRGR